ncbi:UNVERIFIED_CONTAM: hypothetical protein FKN15_024480 [Acipenser sinensis]
MVLLRTLSLVIGGLCYCLQACADPVQICVPIRSGYGTVTLLCYVENDSNVTLPMLRDGATLNQTTSVNGTALELPQEIAEDNATFTSTDLNKEDNFINKNPYFIPVIVIVVIVVFVVVLAVYRKKVMRAFSKCCERSRNMEDAEAGQEIPMRAVTGQYTKAPVSVFYSFTIFKVDGM